MTEEQVKEVIFAIIVFMQGPPIDTQLGEWEKAVNEIYEVIAPTLTLSSQNGK